MAIALADMNRDGKQDLIVIAENDRKCPVLSQCVGRRSEPVFAAATVLKTAAGDDFVAEDIRADVADWNGDGLPDIITGSRSGSVKIAYNRGTPTVPAFAAPTTALDAEGLTARRLVQPERPPRRRQPGRHARPCRVLQLGQHQLPDQHRHAAKPRLPDSGTFSLSGPESAVVDMHALCDGPIVDFADFNGDGTIDLVAGGEVGGKVRMAFGQSGESYVGEIREIIAAHPQDLGAYLSDPANMAAQERMQSLQGALYDYVVSFATPRQKKQIGRGLVDLIADVPAVLPATDVRSRTTTGHAVARRADLAHPLMVEYDDPAARRALADAAQLHGRIPKTRAKRSGCSMPTTHRIRAGPKPSTSGSARFRGKSTPARASRPTTGWAAALPCPRAHEEHLQRHPVDGGEYGFGKDARQVIGDRGSENWFMTVCAHEACHDLDAYVRQRPDLYRRWGQTLVLAGGPDMRADPATGWLSWELTKQHFREAGSVERPTGRLGRRVEEILEQASGIRVARVRVHARQHSVVLRRSTGKPGHPR